MALGVNLFCRLEEGVKKISDLLSEMGAREVLGEHSDAFVLGLDHARALATDGLTDHGSFMPPELP
ncbi:MAG TPA: phosphopantothenate/pantothenate synthetase family protein [Methanothrix sp.]|nr:phosphopantothenate/pantothenate synthetase family protein [Methanothrix sp.]